MTREEAHNEYDDWSYMESSDVDVVVDEIYDDFESRICENCTNFNKNYNHFGSGCEKLDFVVSKQWSCGDFEKKD